MDRYPANGKLLKVYGRYMEFVCNDPWGACKYYAESAKLGTEESLLNLAASSTDGDIQTKLTVMLGTVDEKVGGARGWKSSNLCGGAVVYRDSAHVFH